MRYPERLRKHCPVHEKVLLKERTSAGIGGSTPLFLEPRNQEEFIGAVLCLCEEGLPFRIIGGGTNLLVGDDGISEIVISTRGLSRICRDEERPHGLLVEAGASLARFVSVCHQSGFAGAEGLVGIPGTAGGAAVMNAGGRHGTMGSLVRRVTMLHSSGRLETREVTPADFTYRGSTLKEGILIQLLLELEAGEKKAIWDRMSTILKDKKRNQPLLKKSCGCIFKNPADQSAGMLLESVGMKGEKAGEAEVSAVHANFIVNNGKGTFADFYTLISEGQRRVRERHGIDLELEIDTWI